ncbi:DUF2975 domain-containing protein [Spirosoma soli]|uniref:DUF2975 domain-containing protein n=1 Tax=Spirosoma soli TaxID=1770529 RepID=A0ABW5LXX9_9BACT
MKRIHLIPFLSISFLILYRGCIWLGLLFLLISSPLWQEAYWRWSVHKNGWPVDGPHIVYDTAANQTNYESGVIIRGKSVDFPFTIRKSEIENEVRYTVNDSVGRHLWIKTAAQLKQGPDSLWQVIRSAEQLSERQQKAKIDSTLRANPEVYIIKKRNGYYVKEPSFMSYFPFRMAGGYGPMPKSVLIKNWQNNNANDWEFRFIDSPTVKVRQQPLQLSHDYYLTFEYRTWRQFKTIPISAILLNRLQFLLAWMALLIGFYQLKRLFEDLSENRYFGPQQSRRINRVGWVLICYFTGNILLINAQNLYVRSYFAKQNFHVHDGFIPVFPDNWSLLLSGLTLLVLAHVFDYGRQLKEENELTI